MKIATTTPYIYKNNIQSNNYSQYRMDTKLSFKGPNIVKKKNIFDKIGEAYSKVMSPAEDKMAKWFVKLLEKKPVERLARKISEHPSIKNKLTAHLIVLGSTALSAFYAIKTYNNKNMDEDKRKTLAINQALVWGVSTIMAYSFDNWARTKFNDKILKKFTIANGKLAKENPKKLKTLTTGMEIARTIVIVDMVYRFIAPVIVTPLANYIGNRINKKKQ